MNPFEIVDKEGKHTKEYGDFMTYVNNLNIDYKAQAYKQRYSHSELRELLNRHCYDIGDSHDVIYGGEPDDFGNPGPYYIDKFALILYIAKTSIRWRNARVFELKAFIDPIFKKYEGREYTKYEYVSNVVGRIVKRCD